MKTNAPPMIDPRVWELTKKKVKKNRTINLLVGLAALDPAEALELLSMNARDRSAYGGLPYLTCRQAILVRQDGASDPIVDLRFRRMMADLVMASNEDREAWLGHPSIEDFLSRACPMWFYAAMSERFLSLIRDQEYRTPGFFPYKIIEQAEKMTEDALRLFRIPDFIPTESSYNTPYPWVRTTGEHPFIMFEAAELLWSSLDARSDEAKSLRRLIISRRHFSTRWIGGDSPLFAASLPIPRAVSFAFGLLHWMVSNSSTYRAQGRMADIERLLEERTVPNDSLRWLAEGIVSANVLSDEALMGIAS